MSKERETAKKSDATCSHKLSRYILSLGNGNKSNSHVLVNWWTNHNYMLSRNSETRSTYYFFVLLCVRNRIRLFSWRCCALRLLFCFFFVCVVRTTRNCINNIFYLFQEPFKWWRLIKHVCIVDIGVHWNRNNFYLLYAWIYVPLRMRHLKYIRCLRSLLTIFHYWKYEDKTKGEKKQTRTHKSLLNQCHFGSSFDLTVTFFLFAFVVPLAIPICFSTLNQKQSWLFSRKANCVRW